MKKNKHKKFVLFFAITLLALAGFFGLKKMASASSESVRINEVMYDPEEDDTGNEWIELYNPTNASINLDGWTLKPRGSGNKLDYTFLNFILDENSFVVIHLKKAGVDSKMDLYQGENSGDNLSNTNGSIALYNKNSTIVDYIEYGSGGKIFESAAISAGIWTKDDFIADVSAGKSIELIDKDNNLSSDWQESYVNGGTPRKENSKKSSNDDTNSDNNNKPGYSGKAKINEIIPSPATGEKEMIEIINLSDETIDFSQWYVKDEKDNKKILSAGVAKNNFYYQEDSFSLNSEGDSVYLYDENNNLIDTLKYASSQTNKAYAYDSDSLAWRWTSKKTAGAKNEFDKKLSGKINKDDPVYVNVYADFSVDTDSDSQKFTWDFGDGHKSYLQDTRHKYAETGDYSASLKISGNGETSEYFFTVEVKKYKAPKVRIKSISPNPKGLDSKEWIQIQNKSKNKINLETWSIATGWDNLINHPIREKFIIKPGKAKQLYHDICAFTLNNTKTKIELRDPSGKTVQKIKYDRTKNKIEEDEIYQKGDAGWDWIQTEGTEQKSLFPTNTNDTQTNTENNNPPLPSGEDVPLSGTGEGANQNLKETSITLSDFEIQEGLGKFSEDPAWSAKKETKIILLSYNTKIKTPPYILKPLGRVAGASTERNILPPQKHWVVNLLNSSWLKINSGMNWVLNKIL